MAQVGGRRRERDLRVARHFDFAQAIAVVGDRQPAHFHVVFHRHRDVEIRRDAVVHAMEAGALRSERDEVVVGFASKRLRRRGPHGARPHVAQIDVLTTRITRGVAAIACDRAAAPAAGSAAGIRHDREVVAVGQERRVRELRGRRTEPADGVRAGRPEDARRFERMRRRHWHTPWHALLEQQLGRLDARIGVEALDHAVVEQRIRHCHERHALVVRKRRAHHGTCSSRTWRDGDVVVTTLDVTRRVVDGVEKSERTFDACCRQPA